MQKNYENQQLDAAIRHFVYTFFAGEARPPSTQEAATQLGLSVAGVEAAFERLAEEHHLVLAPGTHTIWMAHPFSGLPTNYSTRIGSQTYWANCAWDVFGIAAILGKNATADIPCGCGVCNRQIVLEINPDERIESNWLVHFVVPAAQFWDRIGYT